MKNEKLFKALSKIRPGAEFSVNGGRIVDWLKDDDLGNGEPSLAEIEAAIAELDAEAAASAYKEKRKAEYPDIGDQLDAIWKYLATKDDLTDEAKDLLAEIENVKSKYPKGE